MLATCKLHIDYSADTTIEGSDVIVEAPSATGKTNSLCISAPEIIDTNIKACQVLVLTSSFDLAQQIQTFTRDIGQFMPLDYPASLGRSNIDDDISALHRGQQFVVGTPNRVLQLIQTGALPIESLKLFALDDAYNMVMHDFTEHILNEFQPLLQSAQVVFSSTAMSENVLEAAYTLSRDLLHIFVSRPGPPLISLESVKQFYIPVESKDRKCENLHDLREVFGDTQVIIFCNLRKTVEMLADAFKARGVNVSAMHRDMMAFERAAMADQFRSGSIRTLLATNMLATGMFTYINAPLMSSVINYDLPDKQADYIYRTSSGSRIEQKDITVNLVTTADVCKVRDIELYTNTKMEETTLRLLAQHQSGAASEPGQVPCPQSL